MANYISLSIVLLFCVFLFLSASPAHVSFSVSVPEFLFLDFTLLLIFLVFNLSASFGVSHSLIFRPNVCASFFLFFSLSLSHISCICFFVFSPITICRCIKCPPPAPDSCTATAAAFSGSGTGNSVWKTARSC